MKLNWFSPLPPARTGIAWYTAALLPSLCREADITLWTQQLEWDEAIERQAPVRRYDSRRPPWAELSRADANVYQLGNSELFHAGILTVSRQQPGLVVLHDLCLQHLFAPLYGKQHDRDGYIALMRRYHGPAGEAVAAEHWSGARSIDDVAELCPLTAPALERALGVVVHTREAFDRLASDNRRPIAYAALPHPTTPLRQRPPAAPPQPPYRLICFGHLGPNRRLDALLESLSQFREREQFRLAIYGDVWEPERLQQRIASLGLDQLVTLHGFVSDADIDAALAAAHLAVNLRYPTMGEASLSQLQIWDHALPSLVTRAGWYATLPPDAVAFVRAEHEWTDVQTHLRAFLADPAAFARMGSNGRRALETRHAPEEYAREIVAFAAETQAFQPRAAAFELAARAGGELRAWLSAGTPADALRRVAEELDALTAATPDPHPDLAPAARPPAG